MKFTQFLGYVFEGAFKAGFLHDKLAERDYHNFLDGFHKTLKEEHQKRFPDRPEPEIFSFIESALEDLPYSPLHSPQRTRLRGLNINENNAHLVYTTLAFNIGYAGGYLYGRTHRNVDLKKYVVGEESSEIVWGNADLLFLEDKKLYVIDFKATGLMGIIRGISVDRKLQDRGIRIPFTNYGASIHLSLGYPKLNHFIQGILKQKDALLRVDEVSVELKGILQLPIYAADFIYREKEDISIAEVSLLYPFQDPFVSRLKVENPEELGNYIEELRSIYRELKHREPELAKIKQSRPRIMRLKSEYRENISRCMEEMEKRSKNPVVMEVGDIDEAREDVALRVREFSQSDEAGILVLLHSAGSGKTSNVRRAILSSQENEIVIYLASRKALVQKEFKEVMDAVGGKLDKKQRWKFFAEDTVGFIIEKSVYEDKEVEDEGNSFASRSSRPGILNRMVGEIKSYCGSFKRIWAFGTIQSITTTSKGATSEHLRKLLSSRVLDNYRINIILDEFLGHNNGLYAIREVSEFASKVSSQGKKVKVYLFDANGFTPELMVGLLREFHIHGVVPDGIVVCNHKPSMKGRYMDLPVYFYAKHGFPANGLVVYEKFIPVLDSRKDGISKIVKYINETFENRQKSTAFLFLQNKEMLVDVSRALYRNRMTTLVATATSRVSQERINKGNEDMILGTSSISRGLDFKRPHKPVDYIYIVVADWGVEKNLVEIIQAISRARGDEETESRTKHLHLIYLIEEPKEYQIENLANLLEISDEEHLLRLASMSKKLRNSLELADVVLGVIRTFLEDKEGQVLVPVPAQHETSFKHNKISELETTMTHLMDIYMMEMYKSDVARKLLELISLIDGSVHVYARSIEKDLKGVDYYHPYVLIKDAEVTFLFTNENRGQIRELCDELRKVFDKHNLRIYREIVAFVNEATRHIYRVPVLVPVYSLVLTEQVLCREDSVIRFRVNRRVGRGGAQVLGGSTLLHTRCASDESGNKEYACIPLGEDYPYLEVLSGRFVNLPIEFVKAILETDHHGICWQRR